jgi:hypothetical protein
MILYTARNPFYHKSYSFQMSLPLEIAVKFAIKWLSLTTSLLAIFFYSLTVYLRLASNSGSSSLNLLSAGITGTHHHAWLSQILSQFFLFVHLPRRHCWCLGKHFAQLSVQFCPQLCGPATGGIMAVLSDAPLQSVA